MHALAADEILIAWEAGQTKHLVDKALLFLSLACPENTLDELTSLTVGQRNSKLLALRQMTLGKQADCFVACPACAESLEFQVDTSTLNYAQPTQREFQLSVDDWQLAIRLPNSLDLAQVVKYTDDMVGRQLLIERCVMRAEQNGQAVPIDQVSENIFPAVADAMLERDPQAEIEMTLNCGVCGHTWQALFDIVAFFWIEIDAHAKRLLRDVHVLARAYGWSEADIFALSAKRRRYYLELVS